tara:strand:- start:204 stop:1802 length:1599 start_codon:yes stop_codon:yes gene_type:complete
MKLALNMMVKNEAGNIAECIASVQLIVNEIIILDTGSSDDTVSIARDLGAKIFHFEWCDDFAVARNEALSKVSAEWVLVLDADERIAREDHQRILEIIDNDSVDAYLMYARNYLKGTGYDKWSAVTGQYPEMEKGYAGYRDHFVLRLFRNYDYLKWDGRVHENLLSADPTKRWFVKETDLVIHHYGKVMDEKQLNSKKQKYLIITKKKADEHPNDAKAQFELGVQLHELGMWRECLKPFERAFALSEECKEALYFIGNTFHKLGDLKKSEETLEKFLKLEPTHCDAIVTLSCVKNENGESDSSLMLLDRAIAINADMFGAWFNKGVFLLKLERYKEAEPVFEKVLMLMPDYVPAMYGKWYANVFLGNFEIAESCMKKWIAEHTARQVAATKWSYRSGEQKKLCSKSTMLQDCNTELKSKIIEVARKLMMTEKFEIIIHAIGPIVAMLEHAVPYCALGTAYLWANRINEAESNLEKALTLDKTLNTARVNLAQIKQVHRKDIITATKLYEEALQYEPQNEFVLSRIKLLKNIP